MIIPCKYPLGFAGSSIRLNFSAANGTLPVVVKLFEKDIRFSLAREQERIGVIVSAWRRYHSERIGYRVIASRCAGLPICNQPLLPKTKPRQGMPQHTHRTGHEKTWHCPTERNTVLLLINDVSVCVPHNHVRPSHVE